jgi:hypothetical protein
VLVVADSTVYDSLQSLVAAHKDALVEPARASVRRCKYFHGVLDFKATTTALSGRPVCMCVYVCARACVCGCSVLWPFVALTVARVCATPAARNFPSSFLTLGAGVAGCCVRYGGPQCGPVHCVCAPKGLPTR